VLQSAFFTNVAGYSSRFVLTNTSSTAAPFTSVMITEAGNTCTAPVSPYAGTIPANGQLVVLASDVCSAFSGPKPRGAVEFTVSAPATSVTGVSYVQSPDMSISTNALQRPGM
jgi:hypothetical protein